MTRSQISAELGFANADRRVTAVFRERMADLSSKPSPETLGQQFNAVRAHVVETFGWAPWITCLAVVRGWRDIIKDPQVLHSWSGNDVLEISAPK